MPEKRTRKTRILAVALLVAGAVFVAVGAIGGGFAATMQKAIFICMECIGLG